MAIFKLKIESGPIDDAELVLASPAGLELEKHLEAWLENSPWALVCEPLLIIGRQTSASSDSATVFPDLLALDKDGNLVVIELKKSKAPREVTAQILEYAAWASDLTHDEVISIAGNYLRSPPDLALGAVTDAFMETFEADRLPPLNARLRLFIAAEAIPQSVARVCRFLRTEHDLDISCIAFTVYKTSSAEIVINSDVVVGHEETRETTVASTRWSGDKPVRQVVWEAVLEATRSDRNRVFTPREIAEVIQRTHPNFNRSTIGCQITSDCVNHPSRHHYPGGIDRYRRVEKGKYQLLNGQAINAGGEPQKGSVS